MNNWLAVDLGDDFQVYNLDKIQRIDVSVQTEEPMIRLQYEHKHLVLTQLSAFGFAESAHTMKLPGFDIDIVCLFQNALVKHYA